MMRRLAILLLGLLAAACAPTLAAAAIVESTTALLLLGEQHDEPDHQKLQREMVQALAGRGVLAALALEMAEEGASTAGLAREA
ncbi:MAG: ChaN family lipoprotein, partial [Ramlibacter sp.]|nr:ChaN family lipoprotein [Ramlibacter sp.]